MEIRDWSVARVRDGSTTDRVKGLSHLGGLLAPFDLRRLARLKLVVWVKQFMLDLGLSRGFSPRCLSIFPEVLP